MNSIDQEYIVACFIVSTEISSTVRTDHKFLIPTVSALSKILQWIRINNYS